MLNFRVMKTIIAAVDFSNASAGVLKTATSLAKVYGAQLHLLHVVEPQPAYTAYGFAPDEFPAMQIYQEEANRRAVVRLDEVKESIAAEVNVVAQVAAGSPVYALLDYAKSVNADLVVLGAHGHGVLSSLLLGSVSEGLVRKAAVPTLIVPAPDVE